MAPESDYPPLDDLIDLVPDELGNPQVRQRLRKLARNLDELTAVDEANDLFVDQNTFQRCLGDKDLFPQDVHDRVRGQLERHLGKKLRSKGSARRLRWRELAELEDSLNPTPAAQ